MTSYSIDLFSEFCDFLENSTDLYKLTTRGYPWYYSARDSLFNGAVERVPSTIDSSISSVLDADLISKLHLLNERFDYAFVTKSKMRSVSPNVIENNFMLPIMDYLTEHNKRFVIFEASDYDPRYDLKYFDSKYYSVTVPLKPLIAELFAQNRDYIEQAGLSLRDDIQGLFSAAPYIPSQYKQFVSDLLAIYLSMGNFVLPQLLIFQELFQQLGIQGFFGAMGTAYVAGMTNNFAMVEVFHGYSGEFFNLPPCHVPVRKLYRGAFNIEKNFLLQTRPDKNVIPQQDLYLDENIFSFGMPGLRSYMPSQAHLQSIRDRFGIASDSNVITLVTSGNMDHDQISLMIKKLVARFPKLIVLYRPHPHYGRSHIFDSYPERVKLADTDNKYDLFMVSDAVISGMSSMVVEAMSFTHNVIVIPSDNKHRFNRELMRFKYPGAEVIPICATEELCDKLSYCFEHPNRRDHTIELFDSKAELGKLLDKISRSVV